MKLSFTTSLMVITMAALAVAAQTPPVKPIDGVSKIIGGSPVAPGKYPFMGAQYLFNNCGSSLIHSDILLSAGQCARYFQGNDIYLGGIRQDGTDALDTVHCVQELRHPSYDKSNYDYDFLLVRTC